MCVLKGNCSDLSRMTFNISQDRDKVGGKQFLVMFHNMLAISVSSFVVIA